MPFWMALISGRFFGHVEAHDQLVQIARHVGRGDLEAELLGAGQTLVVAGDHVFLLQHRGFLDHLGLVSAHDSLHSLRESAKVPACSRIGCIWPEFSAYLKAMFGMSGLAQLALQHRPLQQGRVAEAGGREDHPLGAAVPYHVHQVLALLRTVRLVAGGGVGGVVQEGVRQVGDRVAVQRHLVQQPAGDQHEIVVDDVAAGQLDRLDQVKRRLLAERPGQDDPAVVAQRPVRRFRRRQVVADQLAVLFHRQHHAGPDHQIDLGRRRLPRRRGSEVIELADQPPVLVVERDRAADVVVADAPPGQSLEPVAQLLQLGHVIVAADLVHVVLRHVEIAHVDVREHQLPHARQVADHVADAGKQHAVDEIQPAGHPQLDGRARDAANVALVVGVAVDNLQLIAAAQDAERQHAAGVDQLARHINRHVADHFPIRVRLPLACRLEIQILEQGLATIHDFGDRHGRRSFIRATQMTYSCTTIHILASTKHLVLYGNYREAARVVSFSMVSRLIDRSVASVRSSISRSTWPTACPTAVASPGSGRLLCPTSSNSR